MAEINYYAKGHGKQELPPDSVAEFVLGSIMYRVSISPLGVLCVQKFVYDVPVDSEIINRDGSMLVIT